MGFRIAIGRCACQRPYRSAVEERVCDTIQEILANWRSRLPADVAAISTESFEAQIVAGHCVTFGMVTNDGTVESASDDLMWQFR